MSQIYIKEPPTNGKVSLAESQFAWNYNEHAPGSSQDFTGRYGHRVMVEGDSIGLQELCSAVPGRLLQWCSVSSHYSWLHSPNWGPHWHGRRYVDVNMHVVSSVLQEPAILYLQKSLLIYAVQLLGLLSSAQPLQILSELLVTPSNPIGVTLITPIGFEGGGLEL